LQNISPQMVLFTLRIILNIIMLLMAEKIIESI